jgi:hypothetical protein
MTNIKINKVFRNGQLGVRLADNDLPADIAEITMY